MKDKKELAKNIRDTVDELNKALKEANKAGLSVYLRGGFMECISSGIIEAVIEETVKY
jgi:hypothetical protein